VEDKVKTEERIVKRSVSIQKKLKKEKVIEEVSMIDDVGG
jgi:hypothetical protein